VGEGSKAVGCNLLNFVANQVCRKPIDKSLRWV